MPGDDVALEDLDAFLVAFPDQHVDLDRVADGERLDVLLHILLFDGLQGIHDSFLSLLI